MTSDLKLVFAVSTVTMPLFIKSKRYRRNSILVTGETKCTFCFTRQDL